MHRIYAHQFAGRDVETIPQYLDSLIGYFSRTEQDKWAAAEPSSTTEADGPTRHIFIVGFPRSGTTLLEQILGCHPGAVTTDEKDGFPDGVQDFLATPAGLDRLATPRRSVLRRHRRLYWQHMLERGLEHKARVFVDKQPYNTIKLPLIAKLFPEARIVFAVRDPRDVVLSCFLQRFRMNPSNFELLTLEGAASFYDQSMRLLDIYRAKLAICVQQVRHEDILSNFDSEVQTLCTFLDIPWSESMRNFADRARTEIIATPSASQLTQGLSQTGMERWRYYAKELAPVLPTLEPWIERFGYSAH